MARLGEQMVLTLFSQREVIFHGTLRAVDVTSL